MAEGARRRTALRRAAAIAMLLSTAISGGEPPPPAAGPAAGAVVALGDSVPAGSACDCVPFPDLYARMQVPAVPSVNLARGGFSSDDVWAQLESPDTDEDLREAGVIMIMVGANDLAAAFDADGDDATYRRVAARVGANVAATIVRIRELHDGPVTVLVLGYWNVVKDGSVGLVEYGDAGMAQSATATRYVNQALHDAAAETAALYVPTYPAFKGVAGDQDPTDLLADDGDHPNAVGHELIARAANAAVAATR
ncbi:SGNH/GDSL hydrolase family protein [Micromonospora sp. NPDC047740]|uniref:SGNH/GDSL hydrolase family protein n=1 Tax=Micromonospora sp. NPDC047740 TaxID=3364254 RepID=UPI00371C1A80